MRPARGDSELRAGVRAGVRAWDVRAGILACECELRASVRTCELHTGDRASELPPVATRALDDARDLHRRDGNDVGSPNARIACFFPLVLHVDNVSNKKKVSFYFLIKSPFVCRQNADVAA